MAEKIVCEDCKMRAKYDANPKSLISRFWRWHISWCPGWKVYMKSLNEEKQAEIKAKYNLK